jgi:hypothetical protein
VLALGLQPKVDSIQLNYLTEVGQRTEDIAYFSSRASLVAVNSFDLDEAQQQITQSGALVVARRGTGNTTQSYSVTAASRTTGSRTVSAQTPTLSARRPCNISKK